MIEITGLTKIFGSTTAVDSLTLSVPPGQILGYLGPNGAGKTTTVNLLAGITAPTTGSAFVAGYDICKTPLEVKRRIGLVHESGAVYQSLSPWEYLLFVGRLYGLDDKVLGKRIEEFSDFWGLSAHIHRRMIGFSKGMRQKVVIMASLLHNPDVLLLDEPLNGLDVTAALLLKELLKNLAGEGKTIIYCSHILEVVEILCDRAVILDHGHIVGDGSVDTLKKMTRLPSLEAVFSSLTASTDMKQTAQILSRKITDHESDH